MTVTGGSAGPVLGRVAVLVPAAGRGERLGPGAPKALRELGGVPMLVLAVQAMAAARSVSLVVVSAPPDDVPAVSALLASYSLGAEIMVVAGGATRQESVRRALEALDADIEIVLVHDAARPLAPSDLADVVVAAVRAGADAVVPGLALADTVKFVDTAERVRSTPERATLRAVQTPQGFRRTTLAAAHAASHGDLGSSAVAATDDAGLVERAGGAVLVVPGSDEAFKITRPLDLILAEAVLDRRRANQTR
ncbi:MAG: 2-C-methyl-D-erythritol 4-phosphate cytidylyltransferase [Frankiaceae bacterium]|nr:2-C-methyl-D-erythritol 4-phosphate cytidylyltransferase [Frankiaceae bacterium]